MMSRLISLSLFSVASSYQIADTHAHVDYEGMKSAMVSIAEKAKKGAIDQDSINAIQGFLNVITTTLIPALDQDRLDVQTILNDAVARVHQCDVNRTLWIDGTHAGNKLGRDQMDREHQQCRKDEAKAYCDYLDKCKIFEKRTCEWDTKDVPDFSSGDSDEVNEYMEFLGEFFNTNSGPDRVPGVAGHYYTERSDCDNRTNVHANMVTKCDGAQEDFEKAWCKTESELANYCQGKYRNCRCTAERALDEEQEEARGLEQIFQTQFVALQHLECYGRKILDNQTITLSECDLSKSCTDFNDAEHTCPELVYEEPNPATPCSEPEQEYPCTPEWINTHYSTYGGPANDLAEKIDVVEFPTCDAYTPAADCKGQCINTIVTEGTQNEMWNHAVDCPIAS